MFLLLTLSMYLLAGTHYYPANSRKKCEICLKSTIKIPERRRSGVFIVKFENLLLLFLVFLFLTLNK